MRKPVLLANTSMQVVPMPGDQNYFFPFYNTSWTITVTSYSVSGYCFWVGKSPRLFFTHLCSIRCPENQNCVLNHFPLFINLSQILSFLPSVRRAYY